MSQYIFYINENTLGADYKFFDKDHNELCPKIGLKFDTCEKIGNNNNNLDKYYIIDDKTYEANTNFQYHWSRPNVDIETNSTNTELGKGKINTNEIFLNFSSYTKQIGCIWKLCKMLNDDNHLGYNNWYVPSKDEVSKIYENILNHKLVLENIDFDKYDYWSSSQRYSRIYAWYWDHIDKKWYVQYKHKCSSIFFIRSF